MTSQNTKNLYKIARNLEMDLSIARSVTYRYKRYAVAEYVLHELGHWLAQGGELSPNLSERHERFELAILASPKLTLSISDQLEIEACAIEAKSGRELRYWKDISDFWKVASSTCNASDDYVRIRYTEALEDTDIEDRAAALARWIRNFHCKKSAAQASYHYAE